MQMKVAVRTLANRALPPMDVNEMDTVEKFQAMLEHIVPVKDQVLLLKDRHEDARMTPGHLLRHYKLTSDDEVLLVRRLPDMPCFNPPSASHTSTSSKASSKRCASKDRSGNQITMCHPLPALPPFAPPDPDSDDQPENISMELSPAVLPQALMGGQVPLVRPPAAAAAVALASDTNGATAPPLPGQTASALHRDGSKPGLQSGQAATPGTPRCGPAATGNSGTMSQPCTPRTPSTPHPVASWAPPPMTGPKAAPAVRSNTVAQSSSSSSGASRQVVSIRPPPASQRIRRADLQRIGRLGVGAFGVVTLEMDRRTQRTYALKAVSKGYLASLHMEHSVLNEKRILKMVETPFIVRLLATYNGREHVYFLLEAALGGELFTTYERLRLYGSEPHARFYVGCCVEAIAHLHERNVIYRDLKPENLLLDNKGYCKLTDMGLAKVTTGQTYTLVGTPDYMAPEVINCTGHNKGVDWWMLGVLLFELLVGRPPFEADTTEKVYESVRKGINAVRFPEACRKAADLVRGHCHHEPEERLRADATRSHRWFRDFDWVALRALRLPAPLIPRVRGPQDLANFRSCDQEDPPRVPYKDKGTGWDLGFEDDTPNPVVAASVGLTPREHTASSERLPAALADSQPTARYSGSSSSKGSSAPAVPVSAKAVSSPQQGARIPTWALASSACPTKPVAQFKPPTVGVNKTVRGEPLHFKVSHSGAVGWAQREAPMPTSPRAPAAGGG